MSSRRQGKKAATSSRSALTTTKVKTAPATAQSIHKRILAVLTWSLHGTLADPELPERIQRIKGALYDKRFLDVFCDAALLQAYAARWVPGRALAFREVFDESNAVRRWIGGKARQGQLPLLEEQEMICIGGGAGSELIALAAVLAEAEPLSRPFRIRLVDVGPYGDLLTTLEGGVRHTFKTVTEDKLKIVFQQADVLGDVTWLDPSAGRPPLITLLFTITELFAQSRASAIVFLRCLAECSPGTLFLVLDSANEDASAVQVGTAGRAFSLVMLLDGLLCTGLGNDGKGNSEGAWKVVDKVDSRWFRLPDGLQELYPVKIENTRYWMRLYKRIDRKERFQGTAPAAPG